MDNSNQGDLPEAKLPGTDYRAPAPFLAAVSRRRRSVTGDLTAAFDFGNPDFSVPSLTVGAGLSRR